jgi:hypothetical protein
MNSTRNLLMVVCLILGGGSAVGHGTIEFLNLHPILVGRVDAPFFDERGVRLEGPDFLAQLYAWKPFEGYLPVGTATPFQTNGYFKGPTISIPFIPDFGPVWVQVRAWETAAGTTFEEAALSAGWTGTSSQLFVPLTGSDTIVTPIPGATLIGLIYPGKPWIVRHPQPQVVRSGFRAELSVVASSGVASTYQWYEVTQPGESPFERPIEGATNAVYRTPLLEARAS